jgi:DNA-binding phage protein
MSRAEIIVRQQRLQAGGDLLLSVEGVLRLLYKHRKTLLVPKAMIQIASETGLSRETD